MLRLLVAPARAGGRSVFSLVTASFGLLSKLMDKRSRLNDMDSGLEKRIAAA